MDLAEGYREVADFASRLDDNRHRDAMLNLARRLTGNIEKSWAILWLHDEEKNRLHLDHHEPFDNFDSKSSLASVSLTCTRKELIWADRVSSITAANKEIVEWKRIKGDWKSHFFRVQPPNGSTGYLEVGASFDLSLDSITLLIQLAKVIANRIKRHRDIRHLKVYRLLMEGVQTADDWLREAAKIAASETSAELGIVFKQSEDLSLTAVASSSPSLDLSNLRAAKSSLVGQLFDHPNKNKVRVLDHHDSKELQAEFGSVVMDRSLTAKIESALGTRLKSWMAAKIHSDGVPLAIVLVANKKKAYLPGVFSQTDFGLIEGICQTLSRGYSKLALSEAIQRISEFIFGEGKELGTHSDEFLKLLRRHLPGTEGFCVRVQDARKKGMEEIFAQSGSEFIGNAIRKLAERPNPIPSRVPILLPIPFAEQMGIVERLPLQDKSFVANLYLILGKRILANYEKEIIQYLAVDLAQVTRSQLKVREQIENLVQVRHAIRAGLQGTLSINNAWEVYEQIAEEGISIDPIQSRILRDSLLNTKLYAKKASNLVEESRYLLENISRDKLRVGSASVYGLVKESIDCLKMEAERRGIEFELRNDLAHDIFTMDRFLMDISVFNVIDNAVKYAHRDTKVVIRIYSSGQDWMISVRDQGVYILPEHREDIFKPLVRSQVGMGGQSRPGTGLGLAVVREVIKAHGGRVDLTSELTRPVLNSSHPIIEYPPAITNFTLILPKKPSYELPR